MKMIHSGRTFKPTRMALAVTVAFSTLGDPVLAQDTQVPAIIDENGIEIIEVTSQKRTQTLQELAVSAAVITPEQLNAKGITQVQDALETVPGVKIQNIAGTGAGRVFIRGIGTSSGDEFDAVIANGVSLNLDGINSNNASNLLSSMFDVERVEVLKGPQGTLYGSSALGGVVNVITAKPSVDEFSGRVRVQAGNYNQRIYQGMVNIPINDSVAFRLTATDDSRDGYTDAPAGIKDWASVAANADFPFTDFPLFLVEAVGGGDLNAKFGNYGAAENTGYRGKLLIEPSDDFSFLLTYDYQEQAGTSPVWLNPEDVKNGDLICCQLGASAPPPFATPAWYERRYFYRESDTVSAELNYRFTGFADLNVTYSTNTIKDKGQELTALQLATNDVSEQTQDTYEVRLNSLPQSELIWVAGVYFQDTDRKWALNPSDFEPSPIDGSYAFQRLSKPFENANIYGQVTYPLQENLRLTAGMRYSRTTDDLVYTLYKSATPCTADDMGTPDPMDDILCPSYDTVVESNEFGVETQTQTRTTWKLGVEYDMDNDQMVYAHVATGFKSGGLQFRNESVSIDVAEPLTLGTYAPETSVSYEVGSKNRFLNNTLQLNAAAFYTLWDNMQLNSLTCKVAGCNLFGTNQSYAVWYNAGESTQYGLEFDSIWLPHDNGRVTASLSLMKGEYGETDYAWSAPGFEGIVNLDGNEMANTPAYAGNVAYSHYFSFSNGNLVTLTFEQEFSAAYETTHEYFFAGHRQPSYRRTNLSLTYESEDLTVNIFARNLENELTIQSVFPFGVQGSEPRTFGASLAYQF
ncbi:TonB-dependent receptor [Aestuariibacter sp. GS-14]|uniref:TonB-dependent receptor n=1 Tax=Aestuariibacter sp. GS-14 TaxID=2590670 RepID=UPI00112C3B3D|nr:TonB-dependent receptor [Aestuariibacter sp. GS-14]TPV60885.1 TonB-dependent receptor [Aestuariibacter sp. GS-14]